MADDITNKMLLEHMQAMKYELQQQINTLQLDMTGLKKEVKCLRWDMKRGFEEARLHREALQEDLKATMRIQRKHGRKLAQLSK